MTPNRSNAAPADDAPFILLRLPEKYQRSHRILGSIIHLKNYTTPFQHYRPALGGSRLTADENTKLVALNDKLWNAEDEETVNLTDVLMGKKGAKTKAGMLKISELFNARAKQAIGTDVRIEAGQAHHFTCDNIGVTLEDDLLRSPEWKSQILQLWNSYLHEDKPEFLIVTGVYSVSSVTVSWEKSIENELRLLAQLPVAEMAGDPEPIIARKLDLGFEMIKNKSSESRVFAKSDDKLIFALAYTQIYFEVEAPQYTGLRWWNPKKYVANKSAAKHVPRRAKATAIKNAWLGDPYYGFGIDPLAEGDSSEDEEGGEAADGMNRKSDEGDRVHIIVPTPRYKKIEDAFSVLPLSPVQSNGSSQNSNVVNGRPINRNIHSQESILTNGSQR